MKKIFFTIILLTILSIISILLSEIAIRLTQVNHFKPHQFHSYPLLSENIKQTYLNNIKYEGSKKYIPTHSLNLVERNYSLHNTKYCEYLDKSHEGGMSDEIAKIWNKQLLQDIYCYDIESYKKNNFSAYKDHAFTFNSGSNGRYPIYKYMPNCAISKLKFNDFGWTGTNIKKEKKENVIRVAFLGGSTTQQMSGCSYSYTDYVEMYLNDWAQQLNLNVKFETINTGKVAQQSMDFKAITQKELLFFNPDYTIYYEGRNQFYLDNVVGYNYRNEKVKLDEEKLINYSFWLQNIFKEKFIKSIEKGKSNKNYIKANELINNGYLPVDLDQIQNDIFAIKKSLDSIQSKFILCSFTMQNDIETIVKSNSALSIYSYWSQDYGNIPLSLLKEYSDFQNEYFKSITDYLDADFIDVASDLKNCPDIFYDGIHISCEGIQVHGWSVFTKLIPIIEQELKTKSVKDNSKINFKDYKSIFETLDTISFNKESNLFIERIMCNN